MFYVNGLGEETRLLNSNIKTIDFMVRFNIRILKFEIIFSHWSIIINQNPKSYHFIDEHKNQDHDRKSVGQTISGDRIPIDRNAVSGEEATDGNDAENVEHCTSYDGADAQVALGDKCAHDVGKKFRRACS